MRPSDPDHGQQRPGSTRLRFTSRAIFAIVPALVVLVVAILALATTRRLAASRAAVDHTRTVIEVADVLLLRVVEAESGVRAFLATSDASFLGPYEGAQGDVGRALASLRALTRDNAAQQQRIARLDSLATSHFAAFRADIEMSASRTLGERVAAVRAERLQTDVIRSVLARVRREEMRLLAARDARDQANLSFAKLVIVLGGIAAFITAVVANGALASALRKVEATNAQLALANAELAMQAALLEERETRLSEQVSSVQAARAEAEQANAAKSRFLSTMSHELRTPLNAVAGYVDIIEAEVHGPVTDAQREDIRRIKVAVRLLTSIISDILNFAKLESGAVRVRAESVPMSEPLANAVVLIEPRASDKGIAFSYEPCAAEVIACADRERLQQIVLNLLSNAVKFTDAGGAVTLACRAEGDRVIVTVTDTGRGIAPDDLERIFTPFVQIASPARAPSDGVGLGLAISRGLALAMHGDIRARSELGRGSLFELTLPRVNASA